jgi:Domain of unknown function (DUF1707)
VRLRGFLSADAHVRAGDADRERVAAELTGHCAEGRLTPEELSHRVESAYRARTLGELAALTRDLPRLPAPPRPRPRRRGWWLGAFIAGGLVLVIIAALGVGLAELLAHDPVEAAVAVIALAAVVLLAVAGLGSMLAALAPILALGLAARWIGRRVARALDEGAGRTRLGA